LGILDDLVAGAGAGAAAGAGTGATSSSVFSFLFAMEPLLTVPREKIVGIRLCDSWGLVPSLPWS